MEFNLLDFFMQCPQTISGVILSLTLVSFASILLSVLCAKSNADVGGEDAEGRGPAKSKRQMEKSAKQNVKTCFPSFPTEAEPYDAFNKQIMTAGSDQSEAREGDKLAPTINQELKEGAEQDEKGGAAVKSSMPTLKRKSVTDIKAKPSIDVTQDKLQQKEPSAKPSKSSRKPSLLAAKGRGSNDPIVKDEDKNKNLPKNMKKDDIENRKKSTEKAGKRAEGDDQLPKEGSLAKDVEAKAGDGKNDNKFKLAEPYLVKPPKRKSMPAVLNKEIADPVVEPAEIATKQKRPSKDNL